MGKFHLIARRKTFVFDDPQRRCYNGAHGDHHYEYGAWETFDSDVKPEKIESTLKFWRELNDYAVSCRGESAKVEYKVI